MLMLIEEQDQSRFRLMDEQLAEVRRWRAGKKTTLLTLEEFDAAKPLWPTNVLIRPEAVRDPGGAEAKLKQKHQLRTAAPLQ